MVKKMLEYFLHPSTWKGCFAVLTAVGVTLKPELQTQIIATGMGLVGIIQIFVDDADKDKSVKID